MKKPGDRKQSVSVEDLIRLKRAERPDAQFWGSWQHEMRSKIKEAAEHRPSWLSRTLPKVWVSVARWHLPLGATALVALSFVAMREYNAPLPALSAPVPEYQVTASLPVQSSPASALLSELRSAEPAHAAQAEVHSVSPSMAMLGLDHAAEEESAVSFPVSDSGLSQLRDATLSSTVSFTLHGKHPLTRPEEPLSKVAANRDSRWERLLDYRQSASSTTPAFDAQRRGPSKLSQDALTGNAVRRLEARGDMFTLRF